MRPKTLRENIAAILVAAESTSTTAERERLQNLADRTRITGYMQEPYPSAVVGWHPRYGFAAPRGTTMQCVSPYTYHMHPTEEALYRDILNRAS